MVSFFQRQCNTLQKRCFWTFAVLFVVALGVYGYFVQATIVAATDQARFEDHIQELNTLIGKREAEYSTLRAVITYERAGELGFSSPLTTRYAERARLVHNAPINE